MEEDDSLLRRARRGRRVTLAAAAHALGITEPSLSRIERGLQTPTLGLARAIAAYYGLTMDAVSGDIWDRLVPRETPESGGAGDSQTGSHEHRGGADAPED